MNPISVGIPIYTDFDSLDVFGPYQTFTWADMKCFLYAPSLEPVKSFEGVSVLPDLTFEDTQQLDVLFVPGGRNPVSVLLEGHPGHNAYLDFLIGKESQVQLVCSVCTGALLLGGAGLLKGHVVTTHWAFKEVLKLFPGVEVVDDYRRYVQSGNRITGAGISSGLDLAMYIVSLLLGVGVARQGQLGMQYHPQPPFHCGDPDDTDIKDDAGIVADLIESIQVPQAVASVKQWLAQ